MRLSLFALLDDWRSPRPDEDRVSWLRVWNYAHRGLHGAGVPENSMAAFEAATARGFGIECDIQRSLDGKAMVFHDWELDRLTAQSGAVDGLTAEQLCAVTLSGSNENIPTLRALLDQVAGEVPILIEIKSRSTMKVQPICLEVRRVLEGYRGHVAVMSFDPRIVRWFAAKAPHLVRGLVVTEDGRRTLSGRARRHLALWHGRPDFLAYDIRDLPSRFASAQRARGLPVLTWTVRTAELRQRAAEHADAPIAEAAGIEAPV